MPSFSFTCKKCEIRFGVVLEEGEELEAVECLDCGSKEYSCDGYDAFDNPKLFQIQEELAKIEKRVMHLEKKENKDAH